MGMLKKAKENRRATFVIDGQFPCVFIRDYSSLLRSAIEFLGGGLQVESSVRYRFWARGRAELFPAVKIGVKKSRTTIHRFRLLAIVGKHIFQERRLFHFGYPLIDPAEATQFSMHYERAPRFNLPTTLGEFPGFLQGSATKRSALRVITAC
jgi:hypothetical protein